MFIICTKQRSEPVPNIMLKQVLSSTHLLSVSLSIINPLKKTFKTNRDFSFSLSFVLGF